MFLRLSKYVLVNILNSIIIVNICFMAHLCTIELLNYIIRDYEVTRLCSQNLDRSLKVLMP